MTSLVVHGAYGPVGPLSLFAPDEIEIPINSRTAIRVDTLADPPVLYVGVPGDPQVYQYSPHSTEDLNVMCKDVLKAYELGCSSRPYISLWIAYLRHNPALDRIIYHWPVLDIGRRMFFILSSCTIALLLLFIQWALYRYWPGVFVLHWLFELVELAWNCAVYGHCFALAAKAFVHPLDKQQAETGRDRQGGV